MIHCIHKDKIVKVARRLHHFEFRCKCTNDSCHYTLISPKLIEAWENARDDFGKELIITSGFRCQAHNQHVGGRSTSRHTLGLAIDIMPQQMNDLKLLEIVCRKYFEFVLPYKTFIHCDMREL